MTLRLSDIAALLRRSADFREDIPVRGAVIDSREVEPGMLFVALPGSNTDGRLYVKEAEMRGAAGVLTARNGAVEETTLPLFQVDDPLSALQNLATAYRKRFTVPVIAVTGSNGKTTTKEMIAALLSDRYTVAKSRGNLNNHLGLPLSILNWDETVEIAVLELGMNHIGEIARLCEIARPTCGLITNIGKSHLEFLHSPEGVARGKSELLTALPRKGVAFLNGDDPLLREMITMVPRTITYGFGEDCDRRGTFIGLDKAGHPSFRFERQDISLTLPGTFNAINGLAAAVVAAHFEISPKRIKNILERFFPVAQRMQVIRSGDITVIDDSYNANPSSVREMLITMQQMKNAGRRIAVLGDMKELGSTAPKEHVGVGELAADVNLDAFFTLGSDMALAAEAAERKGMKNVFHFASAAALIDHLLLNIQPGDTLLVKGSRSMRMEEIVEAIIRNRKGEH